VATSHFEAALAQLNTRPDAIMRKIATGMLSRRSTRDAPMRASVPASALNGLLPLGHFLLLSCASERHAAKTECPTRDPAWIMSAR
jgi:hypothetical protein